MLYTQELIYLFLSFWIYQHKTVTGDNIDKYTKRQVSGCFLMLFSEQCLVFVFF